MIDELGLPVVVDALLREKGTDTLEKIERSTHQSRDLNGIGQPSQRQILDALRQREQERVLDQVNAWEPICESPPMDQVLCVRRSQ